MATSIVASRRTIIAALVLLTLVIGAVFAALYLPRATITISPATFTAAVEQDIVLSQATQEPDFRRFTLPAKVITAEVEENKTIQRSGENLHEDFARGVVTLHNNQDEEQPLLPKSHLRHEATGVFFLTDNAVRLPPQGTLDVPVTAKEKGAAGNVPAGKFIVDKLPASLQAVVFGESKTVMSGGQVFDNPIEAAELEKAREEMRQSLRERARGELTTQTGGAAIHEELMKVDVEEIGSPTPGLTATSFPLVMRAKASAFVTDENDLLSLTLLALRAKPAADEEFVAYDPGSFRVISARHDFARGEAHLKTSLTGTLARKTEPTVFENQNLAGRSVAEVQEHYKQFKSVGDVQVTLWPFWVKSVPSRPAATKINVQTLTK
jgi:hypothetical protein